jgi:hypothetical protein
VTVAPHFFLLVSWASPGFAVSHCCHFLGLVAGL